MGREFTKTGILFIMMREVYDPSRQIQNGLKEMSKLPEFKYNHIHLFPSDNLCRPELAGLHSGKDESASFGVRRAGV